MFRTEGNNAHATEKWNTNDTRRRGVNYTESDTRDFAFPWTNQWLEEGCNPGAFDSPTRNDIDAAASNLFAMHNRMHDWSYRLGFTETAWNLQEHNFGRGGDDRDAEHGNVQAGASSAGRRTSSRATTRTRSPRPTALRLSPTCTSGSRSPARSTLRASMATTT